MSVIFSILKWLLIITVALGIAVFAFIQLHPTFGGEPDADSLKKSKIHRTLTVKLLLI
ncbi:hypothetical protein P7M11_08855 [Bisgaard Taxon 10/6]|uniref:hypothetical protein n=1 Tax=Exercitatus varius TaxID=67857 RepID=UPI00294B7A55|nr:hypothetical protein [Exercitatus varius]MDG2954827.1 hypothetical protein [Exercitatus varius]